MSTLLSTVASAAFLVTATLAPPAPIASPSDITVAPVSAAVYATVTAAAVGRSRSYEGEKMWRFSAGAFLPTNTPGIFSSDTGYSLAFDRYLERGHNTAVLARFRYSHYGLTNLLYDENADIDLYEPSVDLQWRFGPSHRAYIGPGLGIVIGHSADGSNSSDLAVNFALGYETEATFLEMTVTTAGKSVEQGVILGGGVRF